MASEFPTSNIDRFRRMQCTSIDTLEEIMKDVEIYPEVRVGAARVGLLAAHKAEELELERQVVMMQKDVIAMMQKRNTSVFEIDSELDAKPNVDQWGNVLTPVDGGSVGEPPAAPTATPVASHTVPVVATSPLRSVVCGAAESAPLTTAEKLAKLPEGFTLSEDVKKRLADTLKKSTGEQC